MGVTFFLWDNTEVAGAEATTINKPIRCIIFWVDAVVWFASVDLFREFRFNVVTSPAIVNLTVAFDNRKMLWCGVEDGADVSEVISGAINGFLFWFSVNWNAQLNESDFVA